MEILAFKNQTLIEHVNDMIEYWEKIKYRYIKTIIRALEAWNINLDIEKADEFMKILIKLHDIGKASNIYQKALINDKEKLNGFRHELVSAYYTYYILLKKFGNKNLAFIGALTVMLHHEPIIIGQIRNLRKNELTAEVVLDKLKNFDGMVEGFEELIKKLIGDLIDVILENEPNKDNIIKFVVEMSVRARHMPNSEKLRFIVGTLLLPLVMCDYKGAESREGKAPKFAEVLEVESYDI
ncbi:CRISPR-associated endonuclease Cas3-HD [Methanocaldococcus lauensis]|nr:CRISPR-associated endonuclease Cas3-HD [Methanocaldococcus lauensis]